MSMFMLFVSTGVLFDGAFPLPVSLKVFIKPFEAPQRSVKIKI